MGFYCLNYYREGSCQKFFPPVLVLVKQASTNCALSGALTSATPDFMKTGVAFGDFIRTEKLSRRHDDDFSMRRARMRDSLMLLSFILVFTLLFIRLFYIQIFQGVYYRNLSDNNRLRTTVIHAPRGIIVDRNGVPLVFNVPGFRQKTGGKTIFLNQEQALKLIAQGKKDLEVDSLRLYPYKEVLAHAIGYIGQISKDELEDRAFSGYRGGDIVGKTGIEKAFEHNLAGTDGKKLSEVDAAGRVVRPLGQTDPTAGENIKLALDIKLQQAAFSAMKEVKKGAVVVSTPTGEILALVSKPSFDANLFTLGEGYKNYNDYNNYKTVEEVLSDGKSEPLLNRVISGAYPPGSTFKLVVAAAGLEDKIIDKDFQVEDTGVITVGKFSFSNWYFTQYGKLEGKVDIIKAIKRSNDIFFYKLAEMVGVDRISRMAENFGLGKSLGIDLGGEAGGLVPTQQWKEKTIGEGWYLGDTYHYGIGQGYLLVTPLQVNMWTSVIANGGTLYQPRLVKNTTNKPINTNFLKKETIDLIREGMRESCSTGGVAWPLFQFKIKNSELRIDGKNFLLPEEATTSAKFNDYREVSIACKTGTAQHGGEQTLPHAWITLFAPIYNPQIVVTVLAEESGEGSNVAAPIAKKILEEWFSR